MSLAGCAKTLKVAWLGRDRWSSALPAGSLDYQAPCRHSRVADQNRLKGHIYLNNLIPCLLLLVGVVWSEVAMWFKRQRYCCLNFCS